jgi:hypothetical protein
MYTSYWGHDIDLGDGDYSDGGASEDGEVDISPYAKEELVTIDGGNLTTMEATKQRDLPSPGEGEDLLLRRRFRKIMDN